MNAYETIGPALRANLASERDVQLARERLAVVARAQGTTVAGILRNHGWIGEGEVPPVVIADALDTTASQMIPETTAATSKLEDSKPQSLRARRLDLGTMMTVAAPPIDMVLRGLPLGSCGVILGSGGVGKSMLVLHIAAAVATGSDDLGCLLGDGPRATGRVVYLAGEDDDIIIHHRVHAFGGQVSEDRRADLIATMQDRVDIVPLVGTAPVLVDAAGAVNEDALAQIREAAKGSRLVVIDPLRQFHAAEETNNGHMTLLSKALARIAHEKRCSIIVMHHVNKASARDDYDDAHAASGASAITDNARWVMLVRKMSKTQHKEGGFDGEPWEFLRQRLVKANYAALGPEKVLRRCNGGVLAQVMVRERGVVEHIEEQIRGPRDVFDRETEIYDEGDDALDPGTGEAFRKPPLEKLSARDMFKRDAP